MSNFQINTVPFVSVDVVCKDITTQQILSAVVFVNGAVVKTPLLLKPGASYLIGTKSQGYLPVESTYTPGANPTGTLLSLMPPLQDGPSNLEIQFSPAETNIRYSLSLVEGSFSVSGMSRNGAASVSEVPAGQYNVTATYADYENYTTLFSVSSNGKKPPLLITLTKISDPGVSDSKELLEPDSTFETDPIDKESIKAIVNSLSLEKDPSESIPENTVGDTYFTGAQCRVYIGSLFIDELQAIQWNNQGNRIPVYSYCSRHVDAFASGKDLVQGQLSINYITEGYLYTVLDEYRKSKASTLASEDEKQTDQIIALQKAKIKFATTASSELQRGIDSKLEELKKNPNAVRNANKISKPQDEIRNAIYEDLTFDIVIEIGTSEHNRSIRRLEKCVLTSNINLIDQSGNPIAESYGFLARRAR